MMRKIGRTKETEIPGIPMNAVILIEKTHLDVVRKVMEIKSEMNQHDSFRKVRVIPVAESPTEAKAMIPPAAPDHPTVMTTEGEETEEDAAMIEDRAKVLAGTEVKDQAKARRRNPTNSAQTREPLGEKCSKGSIMKKKCEGFTKCYR